MIIEIRHLKDPEILKHAPDFTKLVNKQKQKKVLRVLEGNFETYPRYYGIF